MDAKFTSAPSAPASNFKSVNRGPRQTCSSVTRSEHDAGQPPGGRPTSIPAFGETKPAAAMGFRDLLPSTPLTSPKSAQVPFSPVEQASRTLMRPTLPHRETNQGNVTHQNMPYTSWSSAPSALKPDARHGASRVYTFMPSTGRVPVPPPLRSVPSSPVEEQPPQSKDMHRRISSASSFVSSPSGATYYQFSSNSGDSYFSSRSSGQSPLSRRESTDTDARTDATSPPELELGKDEVYFSPHDGAMSAYEPRALAESDLTNASIGRTVDEALTALLGATKLVQAGLGSAALVIGPVEGRAPRQRTDSNETERDPTRRPTPPPSHAARGDNFRPPSGLITLDPRAMPDRSAARLIQSSINAQPRAIKAIVCPPMQVVRPRT